MLTATFFTHYLFSKRSGALIKVLSWLCIFGVGMGVFSFVVVLNVMNGFNENMVQRILAAEPHLVVSSSHRESDQKFAEGPIARLLEEKKGELKYFLFESQEVILRTSDGLFSGAVAKGISPESLHHFLKQMNAKSGNKSMLSNSQRTNMNPQDPTISGGGINLPKDQIVESVSLDENGQVKNNPAGAQGSVAMNGENSFQAKNGADAEKIGHSEGVGSTGSFAHIGNPQNSLGAFDLQQNEILMGIDLANELGVLEGDTLVVASPDNLLLPADEIPEFSKVRVKKLITTDLSDIDRGYIFYLRSRTLNELSQSSSRQLGFELWLKDPYQFKKMAQAINELGYKVESWQERNSALFFTLSLEKSMIGTFLGLSGLIACFSIITVITLLISQKKRDIGILMACGMKPQKVQKIFSGIGLLLSLIGIGGGFLLALLSCWLLKRYPLPLIPTVFYDSNIPVKIDVVFMIMVVVSFFTVAYFSSFLAARQLSHFIPSEALRAKND